jgi:hypothetical protein
VSGIEVRAGCPSLVGSGLPRDNSCLEVIRLKPTRNLLGVPNVDAERNRLRSAGRPMYSTTALTARRTKASAALTSVAASCSVA